MYKIHMLKGASGCVCVEGGREGGRGRHRRWGYMKINFLFSESVTGNQLILMYYFMRGRVAAAAGRVATAVLIGEAIYYSWRL